MNPLNPWKFGIVLSLTASINYLLCAAVFFMFPQPSIDFLNTLFHGIDFRKIFGGTPFSPASFAYVLLVLGAWAYVLGVIFAFARNWLRPDTNRS